MEITELILELRIIYDTAPDRFSYLQLPCTVPTATPYAGAGHLAAPRVAPPPKTAPAPLVLPQPTFSGAPELATPPLSSPARATRMAAAPRAEPASSPGFAPCPGCSLPSSPSLSLPPIKRAPAPRACPARPPAIATIAGRRRSSVEPPFRPSSAPIEPLNGFLSPPCTSPAKPRRLSLAGVAPPAIRPTAGCPSPRTRLLRPSPDEPRPPKGSSRAPLPFPPLYPSRRPSPAPGTAAPNPPLFLTSARDLV